MMACVIRLRITGLINFQGRDLMHPMPSDYGAEVWGWGIGPCPPPTLSP
jgi:hypothetical protein